MNRFWQPAARFLLAAALLPALSLPAAALTVFDPENYGQNLLQAARALDQINNQVRQLQNEAQMLENQARNLARLDYSALGRLNETLGRINQMMAEAQGMAFEVQATEQEYARFYPQHASDTLAADQLAADARQRWAYAMDGFGHTLALQSQVSQTVADDAQEMAALVAQSQDAAGLLQAVQATNQLLAVQTKQLLQLEQLSAAQDRAVTLDLARAAAAEERARVQRQRFLGDGHAYTPHPVRIFQE